jgi:hypothetical protein
MSIGRKLIYAKRRNEAMNNSLNYRQRLLGVVSGIAIVLGLLASTPAHLAQAERNPNPGVLPPNSHPHGRTYEQWNTSWIRWIFSIPADRNPLLDETGANCGEGQSGHVWFLAGNFGGTTTRNCNIPHGTMLFFPVLNFFVVNTLGETDQEMLDTVASVMPFIDEGTLEADVEGRQIHNLPLYKLSRIIQPDPLSVFNVSLTDNNIFPPAPARLYRGVGDGYYLMLTPLSAGQHTIHFHGEVPAFGFTLDVTYHLTVGR